MEIPTVKGYSYCVATSSTCAITDTATGKPLGTAWANAPYTFTAQGSTTTLSDADAIYARVNFNSAAGALRLLTGGVNSSPLPEGYLPASFIQFTGARGSFLRVPLTCEVGDEFAFESHMRFTNVSRASYEGSEPMTGVSLFWGIARGQEWCWAISGESDTVAGADTGWHHLRIAQNKADGGFWIDGRQVASVEGIVSEPSIDSSLGFGIGGAATSTGGSGFQVSFAVHCDFRLYKNGVLERDFVPCLHPQGYSCFYDLVTKTPFYLTNTDIWVGMTLEQARRLSEMPAPAVFGDPICLVLPVGWEEDPGVSAAMKSLREKGWGTDIAEEISPSLFP